MTDTIHTGIEMQYLRRRTNSRAETACGVSHLVDQPEEPPQPVEQPAEPPLLGLFLFR
jgi:hypothetical protein